MRADETGRLEGVLPDLGKRIFKAFDISVEVGPAFPWKRLFVMMDNGQLDVIAGAFHTEERKEKYGFSLPVMTEEIAVFIPRAMTAKPGSLTDLAGLNGIKPFGASYGAEFDRLAAEFLSIEAPPFDDFETYMGLLIDGKADYLVMPRRYGQETIEAMDAQDHVEALSWPAAVNTLHFMFSRASPCIQLLDDFNETLDQLISAGQAESLLEAYTVKKLAR
ncbi:transporter substrate-binding domain-containing protein [Labrenzia aggregata]|uniref:Transporter substrate-binding domain-containing protein n=2 Tax=Roseibium aggregatum TaxID=187304 RepID=A0A939EB24_9HYPH|nr:transporter substrate-binding domain-containing protein [Roseibium aggregatum]